MWPSTRSFAQIPHSVASYIQMNEASNTFKFMKNDYPDPVPDISYEWQGKPFVLFEGFTKSITVGVSKEAQFFDKLSPLMQKLILFNFALGMYYYYIIVIVHCILFVCPLDQFHMIFIT